MEKDKPKKNKKIFLKILLFFILLFVIINSIPIILIYNSPFFVKKFFKRDLSFSKLKYLPHKLYLEIENLSLKDKNLELLYFEKIVIDFDYIKLLQLKPTISYIKIIKPVIFFKKEKNQYSLPEYLNIEKKEKSKTNFNIPITIEHLEINDGKINLFENNKFKPVAKDITIILPGIRSAKNIELNPVIYGKIFDREFKINGKTEIIKGFLVNKFDAELKDFNLNEISPFIPDIAGIKIVSGIVNTRLNLIFKSYKNKRPEFRINGNISVQNLVLYDTNAKKIFIDRVNAISEIRDYDIFNNNLILENLNVKNGSINLILDEKNPSIFFKKSSFKTKNIFKFNTKNFNANNTKLIIYDNFNKDILNFNINNLNIKDFNTYDSNNFYFDTEFILKNVIENCKIKGNFNLKKIDISLEYIETKNIYLEKLLFLKNIFNNLESAKIKTFMGQFSYIDKEFKINGEAEIENFYIKIEEYKNNLGAENIKFHLNDFNTKEKLISFKYLEIKDGTIPVDKKGSLIKNINFSLSENKINFIEKTNEKKEKLIQINENININNIKANYISKDKNFNAILVGLNSNIKLELNQNSKKIMAGGNLNISSFIVNVENRPVFKLADSFISVHNFQMFPIIVNINSIEANSPYIVIDIKKDKKLYLLSFNEISFKKEDDDIKLNIDNIKFKNGRIEFTDYSLDEIFKIDISRIEGEIKNFPSFVYPEGEINITGIINNRNPIMINSMLSPIKVKGSLNTKDLLVSQFSPYFNKYLGYKINSGILNLEIPFEIKENNLNAEVRLKLNNLRITKTTSKKKSDLSKIVTIIEDDKGNISLNVPIQGKWGEPNIDFREIFFNIFYDILDNSQKGLSNVNIRDFKKDGTIDIIYFKAGRDEPTSNIDTLISNEMKNRFKDKNKFFIIEGYVDKTKDSEYLKRKILDDKILLYSEKEVKEDSPEEFEVLKKIYNELYNRELTENISNNELKRLILSVIELNDSHFYSLSYARIKKIKEFLMENYNISEDRIVITETNIYENPYIKGVGNSLAVILSAEKME